jgi:ribose/xylose/arabinose/galactoside ABC-type transport system permease subunit
MNALKTERFSRYSIAIYLLLLVLFFALITEGRFIEERNLVNILLQSAINTILAVGMTLVIITGGIDLSVGSVLALCGLVGTDIMVNGLVLGGRTLVPKPNPVLGIPMAMLVSCTLGVLIGWWNGWLIARWNIAPFIVTLATMTIARGTAFVYSDGKPVGNLPEAFNRLGGGTGGEVLGIPVPVWIAIIVALCTLVMLRTTQFGRAIYAVGGNEQAARLSGVDVARVKVTVYVLSGFLAGLCGIVQAARLGAGDPKYGEMYELNAIAAVVLGGASLAGGRGGVGGTVVGAILIGVLDNGLVMAGVSAFYQKVVKGVVILLAVLGDVWQRRQR